MQFRTSPLRADRHRSATLFFDGGCAPNPGPMEAAVVFRGRAYVRDDMAVGDNCEAEWLALLFAVEIAKELGLDDVIFTGDSAVVIAQASGRHPCRSPHLQRYLAAYRDAVSAIPFVRTRLVRRSRNLAGIVLARRHLP